MKTSSVLTMFAVTVLTVTQMNAHAAGGLPIPQQWLGQRPTYSAAAYPGYNGIRAASPYAQSVVPRDEWMVAPRGVVAPRGMVGPAGYGSNCPNGQCGANQRPLMQDLRHVPAYSASANRPLNDWSTDVRAQQQRLPAYGYQNGHSNGYGPAGGNCPNGQCRPCANGQCGPTVPSPIRYEPNRY